MKRTLSPLSCVSWPVPVLVLILACIGLSTGCSDDDGGGDIDAAADPTDASVMTDGSTEPIDAMPVPPDAPEPVVCNMLGNDAPEITVRRSTALLPAPTGGTIEDGTYYLVSDIFYEAAMDMDLGPARVTAEITGDTVQQVVEIMGDPPVATTSTLNIGPGPTEILLSQTCPDPFDLRWDQYSSDGAILDLHYTMVKRVQTFMRQ